MGGTLVALTFALPAPPGYADPDTSLGEAQAKVQRLVNKAEIITEQYRGLQLKLEQAQETAELASEAATEKRKQLRSVRQQVTRLAATRYRRGGLESAAALFGSDSTRALLDRAALLHHMSRQQAQRVHNLQKALQASERAEQAAQQRANRVEKLREQIEGKKSNIEKLVREAKSKLTERVLRAARSGNRVPPSFISGSGIAAEATRVALKQQGDPYVWGAEGPESFDCSGLIRYAYAQAGKDVPGYTRSLWRAGTQIPRSEMKPGDLVFFYPATLHHVGIFIGNGLMVHAPHTGAVVRVDPIEGRPWAGAIRLV